MNHCHVDRKNTPLKQDWNFTEENRNIVATPRVDGFPHILRYEKGVNSETVFILGSRNNGIALKTDADNFDVPEVGCALGEFAQKEMRGSRTSVNKEATVRFNEADGFFAGGVFHGC